mgnify:CR=1 FL=1
MKYWFIFVKDAVMLKKNADGSRTIPLAENPPIELKPWTHVMEIAPMEDGTEVRAASIDYPIAEDDRYETCPLRKSFYHLPTELYLKAGKCRELLYWDQNTQYCGVCGAPTRMDTIISKKCTHCGKEIWPQLATAVIVLVHRGEEVLLVHAKNFVNNRIYGLVAGFVETGETLEEAVRREVDGGDATRDHQPPLFRLAALALPLRTDGGIPRRLCGRRDPSATVRTGARKLVWQRQPAAAAREAEHRAKARR